MSLRIVLAAAIAACPAAAGAARSYDNCTGFIDALPAVISTQGTWCLNRDLSTAMTGGTAITIAANNVVLDCNDFKLGNLAAGTTTNSAAIVALDRQNVTVRHCVIRGFRQAIHLKSDLGGGHVVEDNRIEGATQSGIYIYGPIYGVARRNTVVDTGGTPNSNSITAISVTGDVIDNVVQNVFPAVAPADVHARGIYSGGAGAVSVNGNLIAGNRVRDVYGQGTGGQSGIYGIAYGTVVRDNVVVNGDPGTGAGLGIGCNSGLRMDNVSFGYTVAYSGCTDGGNNLGD